MVICKHFQLGRVLSLLFGKGLNTLGTKDSPSFQVCPFLWSFAAVKQLKISWVFFLSLGPLIHCQINHAFDHLKFVMVLPLLFFQYLMAVPLHFHFGILKIGYSFNFSAGCSVVRHENVIINRLPALCSFFTVYKCLT